MVLPRRKFLRLAAAAGSVPILTRFASAQAYPVRPVRIVVGFTPGGSTDVVGRFMAQWLSDRLGTDNVRDAFYPFGDSDRLETMLFAAVAAHLDDPGELIDAACGDRSSITAGDVADLVLMRAASLEDALARRPAERVARKELAEPSALARPAADNPMEKDQEPPRDGPSQGRDDAGLLYYLGAWHQQLEQWSECKATLQRALDADLSPALADGARRALGTCAETPPL